MEQQQQDVHSAGDGPEQKRALNVAAEFTDAQIADWKAYERVRKGGRFNMFDPRAQQATKLSADRYTFVMKNYSALRDAAARP